MGLLVIASNYLVQFPVSYFSLEEVLTYGAFTYPITFFITDLSNRAYGIVVARKVVYIGFVIGILLTLFISTNFSDIISIRIAIGSGLAFFIAHNIDIKFLTHYETTLVSSTSIIISSWIDNCILFYFFRIAFYGHRSSMDNFSFR